MDQDRKLNFKKGAANTFGAFGYLFGFLQWLWAAALYLSVIQSVTSFITSTNPSEVTYEPNFAFSLPDPLAMIILVVVVVVMIGITIYALVSMPAYIVKTGNKIAHKTTKKIAPTVIKLRHKPNTKKMRLQVTMRVLIFVKCTLIFVPLLLAIASWLLSEQLIDYSIALTVGCGLACFSVIFFSMQYTVAKLFRVKISDLV